MTTELDLSDVPGCLCLAARRSARQITRIFNRLLRPHGLRVTQFTILVMLMRRSPRTIGELAETLDLERTTLSRNVALLAAASWVKVAPGADARSRAVSVTAKGRAVVAASLGSWRNAQSSVAAAIGPAGVKALRTLSRAKLR
jgi:DNA-binding MarR family transcriptional regulator